MTGSAFATAAAWSYGAAVACYVFYSARILIGWRPNARGILLLGATVATSLWAAAGWWFGLHGSAESLLAVDATDALRYGLWFAFVVRLLDGRGQQVGAGHEAEARLLPGWVPPILAIALVASVLLSEALPYGAMLGLAGARPLLALRLGLAVAGLVLTEQLLRRADPRSRWGIKPLVLALCAIFGYDLFFLADALLFGRVDADFFVARGIANALVVPLFAVATARNTGWSINIHVSRNAVFHSTALLLSGGFLLAAAVGGYFVRYFGGEWGRVLQVGLLFAALVVGAIVVSSGRFRSQLRVFVSKHFFAYRFDYREEWLRFTRTLGGEGSVHRVDERVVMALANLVESPAGLLYVKDDHGTFAPAGHWNMPAAQSPVAANAPLPRFLEKTGWVISVPEFRADQLRYPELALPDFIDALTSAWLIVPLISTTELIGFVVLTTSRAPIEVDWEVRDLLKTASRQAASYMGHVRATEALLEARKFDSFNRMSAFVVHDLKNLVAQLALMLRNAERHRNNPEFQRDMLSTVQNVVERMNRLMLQLRMGATPVEKPQPVELGDLVRRTCAAKSATIDLDLAAGIQSMGHADRLEHVIGHLVQNALDAVANSGSVRVRLRAENGNAAIEVVDTGIGMSAEFLRERLFKPFETTKATGMGIGMYESAQYVTALDGRVLVDSKEGAGTRVRVLLPLVDVASPSVERAREEA